MNRLDLTEDEWKARQDAQKKKAQAKYRASHREQQRARCKAYRLTIPPHVRRERYRQCVSANIEKRRAYATAYRESHRAETRAKAKKKREANLEHMRKMDRAYRLAHPDQMRETKRAYRSVNREQERTAYKVYYEQHKAEKAKRHLEWARKNPGIVNAITQRYWAAKLNATPAWADFTAIQAIYIQAAQLTRDTGVKHEVDHIWPLQSDLVCGLHIAANMQILTKADNIRKHNKLPVGATLHECSR